MTDPNRSSPPQPAVSASDPDEQRIKAAVEKARLVVEEELPGYWPRVEAVLAASATLRLKDLDNCTTLMLIGPPSSGKSSTLDMLRGGWNTITVDRITPAAFVANTMGKTDVELQQIDLLTRIKHKVMLTREMGMILRGGPDALKELFKVLTNVLDGKGYAPATATQGLRSLIGDYVFVWLGGTTPIPQRTWDIQVELGSRLMFFDLGHRTPLTDDEVLLQRQGKPFKEKITLCQDAVSGVLVTLFLQRANGPDNAATGSSIRSIEWEKDPEDVTLWLVRLGRLLAHGRWKKSLMADDESSPEDPHRNVALLENLARGRAMLYGRHHVDLSDLALPTHVVFSSMPHGRLWRAVAKYHQSGLTIPEGARECGCTVPTATARMNTLAGREDIVEWGVWTGAPCVGHPPEKALHPTTAWQWLGELSRWL